MTRGTSKHSRPAGALEPQDVVLCDAGADPAGIAELVRSLTGLPAADARALVARVPCVVRARVSPALAEALRNQIAVAGGHVEVRAHSPSAPVEPPPRPSEPAAESAPEGEDDGEFEVVLRECGPNKISVIKVLREVTTLGLKDAKDLAESAPARVRLGVSESRAVAIQRALVAVGAVVEVRDGSGAAVSEPEPEPARVDVVLRDCGPRKIQVIKAIRECTHLGLKEAKDLAETAGATIKADVSPDEAAEIERQLTAAGATVELRSHADESTPADAPAEVDVFLRSFGANKIAVIKEVRALTGLGLKEAKDLVESAPCLIREAVDLAVAEELQRVLTRYGAVIELR